MLQVADGLAVRAKLFRGLGDPSRLALLEQLRDGPRTVTELVERTGLGQSNASMHLACLKDCGLVTSQSQGRFAVYALSEDGVAEVLDAADRLLARVGERVYACTRSQ